MPSPPFLKSVKDHYYYFELICYFEKSSKNTTKYNTKYYTFKYKQKTKCVDVDIDDVLQ